MIILRQKTYSELGKKINEGTRKWTAAKIRRTRKLMQDGTALGKPSAEGGLKEGYKKVTGQLLREAKVTDTVFPNSKRHPVEADKGTIRSIREFFGQLMSHRKSYGKPVDGGAKGSASDISHIWNGKYKS